MFNSSLTQRNPFFLDYVRTGKLELGNLIKSKGLALLLLFLPKPRFNNDEMIGRMNVIEIEIQY